MFVIPDARFNLSLFATALAALNASATQAQTAPSRVDKVIVTASPFADQDELQAVQPGVVVGKEALLRDRAASLGDTLSTQAGIQSSSFGPVRHDR